MEPAFTDTLGAAQFTGIPAATLATLRVRGGGPAFCKVNTKVVYSYDELTRWLEASRRTSTSAAPEIRHRTSTSCDGKLSEARR